MSKHVIYTHAGDDSDGKIWGIEGLNILFILAGLITSIGLALLLYRIPCVSPLLGFLIGAVPFVGTVCYVFGFRQGKPKAYDRDLFETLSSGNGWQPLPIQPRHPLLYHERT